jgi:hypothetical protein
MHHFKTAKKATLHCTYKIMRLSDCTITRQSAAEQAARTRAAAAAATAAQAAAAATTAAAAAADSSHSTGAHSSSSAAAVTAELDLMVAKLREGMGQGIDNDYYYSDYAAVIDHRNSGSSSAAAVQEHGEVVSVAQVGTKLEADLSEFNKANAQRYI